MTARKKLNLLSIFIKKKNSPLLTPSNDVSRSGENVIRVLSSLRAFDEAFNDLF